MIDISKNQLEDIFAKYLSKENRFKQSLTYEPQGQDMIFYMGSLNFLERKIIIHAHTNFLKSRNITLALTGENKFSLGEINIYALRARF